MSVLRHLAPGGSERRDFSNSWGPYGADGRIPPPSMDGGATSAGVVVNERTSLQIIDVYACVSHRADAISMLPAKAFRKAGEDRSEVSPAPSLVAQPDSEMEAGEYWAGMEVSLLLRGNAYSAITARDAAGWPTAVKLLHPDDVHPHRHPGPGPRKGRIQYRLANGTTLDHIDMIHVRGITIPGELAGMGPIECARRGIGNTIATENFGANWFRDGASPSSVLETDQDIDPVKAKETVARWVATHGGRRRPALLAGGLKWRPVTLAPNDSQWLEAKQFNGYQINKLFRMPNHMVGDTEKATSFGSGLEEAGIGYVVYTIGPDIARFEAAFTRALPRPQYLKFVVAALLRGNTRDRFTSYAIARQWGWMSVNDIRQLEDLSPVDGGDAYLQPLNMIDAQEALKVLLGPQPATGGNE